MESMSIDDDSAFFEEEEVPVTHPRCYSSDHVEKLETFAQDLNQALQTSFPSKLNPYTSVHVLLLRWTEDDLGVQTEISALREVFETRFFFIVEEWQIPSVNSMRILQKKLYGFQEAHQDQKELLIVYYGGHAKADHRRGRSIWQAHSQPNSPSLNWSSLQPLLETAIPHVLIILDCCFAATAARDTTEGCTKEILAACGRESPTHGVGQRSFTSALTEELQAFEGGPFTAAMLHSRLVTMRWRLAFTPIYALLSERGGNSITICPFAKNRAWHRPGLQLLAELEAPNDSQDTQVSMAMNDSPISQPPRKQTVDTRVLLSVSVVQDAVHDVPHWASWLTTAAPWDVTKVDVQVHSVFKSHSTLVVVSVPTYAWDRLPERPAYRFIGFIRSGDDFQAARSTKVPTAETVSTHEVLPISSSPNLQPHKRQRTDISAQPTGKKLRSSSRLSDFRASQYPPRATPEQLKTPEMTWSSGNDEILTRARQQGLNWSSIASTYFPDKTANACRKRHERLTEKRNSTDNWDGVKIDDLSKAYLDLREPMWRILADRVGEKWQNVEAKCMEKGLETRKTVDRTASRGEARLASPGHDFKSPASQAQDQEDGFEDSAIGVEDHPSVHGELFRTSRDDYPAGDLRYPSPLPSYSSAPSVGVDSNALSSYVNTTPTMTAAPQLLQPQKLPSFSATFSEPDFANPEIRSHYEY